MATVTNLANYSPEDVVIILSNDKFSHTVSGLADGTFVSYERSVPRATLYTGADLSAGRVLRRNKSGTITLTLHQMAESNDILSEVSRLDEEAHNNDWLFSVTIKDLLGRTVLFAPEAFIGNDPSISFGTDVETREWTIEVINVERHFGGNSKFNPESQELLEGFGYIVEDKWKTN